MINTIDIHDLILDKCELGDIREVRRAKREVTINLVDYNVTHPDGDDTAFEIRRVQGKNSDWSLVVIPKKGYMAVVDNRGKKPTRTIIEGGVWVSQSDPVRVMNPIISRMPDELELGVPWMRAFHKDINWRKGLMNFLHEAPEALELCGKGYLNIDSILHVDYDGKTYGTRVRRWGNLNSICNPTQICEYLAKAGPYAERHRAIRGDVTSDEIAFVTSMSPVIDALEEYMGQLVSVYIAELCHVTFDVQTQPATRNGILGDYSKGYGWRRAHQDVEEIDLFKAALRTISDAGISLRSPDIMDYTIKSMIKQGFDTQPFAFFMAWAENLQLQKINYGEIETERPDMLVSENQRLFHSIKNQLIYITKGKIESLTGEARQGTAKVNSYSYDSDFIDYEVRPVTDDVLAEIMLDKAVEDYDSTEFLAGKPYLAEIVITKDEIEHYNYCAAVVNNNRIDLDIYHSHNNGYKPWDFGEELSRGAAGPWSWNSTILRIVTNDFKQLYGIEMEGSYSI